MIPLDGLSNTLALHGIEVLQGGAGDRERGIVQLSKVGGPRSELVGQEGYTFRRPIGAETPALQGAVGGSYGPFRTRHLDVGHLLASLLDQFRPYAQRWDGAVGNEGGQPGNALMHHVQPRDAPVVLHAQVDLAALGVGQAHRGQDQLAVRQSLDVALELDVQGFGVGDASGHVGRVEGLRSLVWSKD